MNKIKTFFKTMISTKEPIILGISFFAIQFVGYFGFVLENTDRSWLGILLQVVFLLLIIGLCFFEFKALRKNNLSKDFRFAYTFFIIFIAAILFAIFIFILKACQVSESLLIPKTKGIIGFFVYYLIFFIFGYAI